MESIDLVREIVRDIDEKKGKDIKVLDIHEKTGIADFFVICTGASRPQTRAIADFIELKVEENLGEQVLRQGRVPDRQLDTVGLQQRCRPDLPAGGQSLLQLGKIMGRCQRCGSNPIP